MKNLFRISILLLAFIVKAELSAQVNTCDKLNLRGEIVPTTEKPPNGTLPPTLPPVGDPEPPTLPPVEMDKIVFWIHGFGGSNTSWTKASAISTDRIHHSTSTPANPVFINDLIGFPARQIISDSPGYESGFELPDYGEDMDNQIRQKSISEKQEFWESQFNFCIPHSFGGLVARRAEIHGRANEGFRAGGIATFGTPHHGAVLANNLLEIDNSTTLDFPFETSELKATEKFKNFLDKAANDLLAGKIADASSSFILSLFSGPLTGAIEDLVDKIVEFTPSLVGGLFSKTALNLQVGNEQVEFLNNNPNFTKNVTFYGVENRDQTLWRLFYWGVNDPNNPADALKSYAGEGYFDANDDRIALQNLSENIAKYEDKVVELKKDLKKLKEHAAIAFFNWPIDLVTLPFLLKQINQKKKAIAGYEKGIAWWQNSSSYWDLLSGALSYETTQVAQCFCDGFGGLVVPVDCNDMHSGNYTNCFAEYVEVPTEQIYKPNDGAVLQESAIDFPGSRATFLMEGSCHFQMRNDENTKAALLALYDGESNPYLFFKTEKKTF